MFPCVGVAGDVCTQVLHGHVFISLVRCLGVDLLGRMLAPCAAFRGAAHLFCRGAVVGRCILKACGK